MPRRDRHALLAAGALGLLVALIGSLLPEVIVWLGSNVPGTGLLRDGSRFLALLAPLAACLFGLGVSAVAELVRSHPARISVATSLVLLPIALLPDLGLGLAGQLRAVQFPAEYSNARQAIDDRLRQKGDGDLLLLPFNSYRVPSWNDGRRTLDPLGRFMTPNYLASDTLVVSDVTVAGEDERARRVADLLKDGGSTRNLARQLGREGIRWVLLDKEAQAMVPASVPTARFDGLPVIHRGSTAGRVGATRPRHHGLEACCRRRDLCRLAGCRSGGARLRWPGRGATRAQASGWVSRVGTQWYVSRGP